MKADELDLCFLSATEALEKFQSRELSPVELCKALIKRNEAVGATLNATTYTFFERALKAAREAEKRYAKPKGRRTRPLEGLTIGIKDFHSVKGEVTTYGSKIFKDHKPDQTAPTVDRLLKAGAILFSRTTTPEFAYSGVTRSPLWGITRNPWGLDCTPGGSSGGASASIAAGLVTLCDGTDGGGSCRIPASLGGVVGYKPPFGRNPMDREHPLENLLHYGPITRSVADAALMQNVMSGQHVADMCSLRENVVLPDQFESIRGMKIAYTPNYGFMSISPDVQKNTKAAVTALRRLGAKVEEVDLQWNWGAMDTWLTRWEGAFSGLIGDLLPRWRYDMSPFCLHIAEKGLTHSAARFYNTNAGRFEQWQTLGPILEKYDALIGPTLAVSSLPVTHDEFATDFTIDGEPVQPYVGWSSTWLFNNLAWCPAMSIPSGFGDNDMPTGLQIVGRTFDDPTVFRIASAFERARPWCNTRPPV